MRSDEQQEVARATGKLSLILPLPHGMILDATAVLTDYRRLLEAEGSYRSVEAHHLPATRTASRLRHCIDDRSSSRSATVDVKVVEE